MLKAVVFDDEFIVLKGLQKLIDWSEYGVELVGTAADGLSALEVFRRLKPDIVMTDIRMPGMDGLQLIEIIRMECPDTMCIVFSGYNEFEYVKRAIKLGVVDYLEKPVTITKIREGIQKAVNKITELNELSSLKQKWQQGLLEKTTLDLLLQGSDAEAAWAEQFGPDAYRLTGITVLACSNREFDLDNGASTAYRTVSIRNGSENLVVVFHFDSTSQEWTEDSVTWSESAIGSGRTYSSLADAPKSYKEALRALRYGKYLEGKGWIRFEDLGDSHAVNPNLSEREEEVLFDMRVGDKEGLMKKLDGYLEEFRNERLDPEVAEIELLKMVFHGWEVAKETGGNPGEIKPAGYLPQLELRNMQTQDEMAAWLRHEMETIMDWIIGVRQRSKHSAVEKAIRYISDHFGRDLTQQEVADHVEMNATYFSLLFKEQMGISYIKYLTKVRMEKAKELLNEGLPIHEISEKVGYYHARHFSEVFKKQTGMTPGQYRSNGGGS
ncbi:response regulator transcription factor [Cohnella cholangitidis]|uniref:Response regulator transcription factor n=1 Tax=Cohnella cholangitidis TaxID=2598458 RepID=A0A7G5BZU2_9BACL|nr:response regulator transcription factor [Cohnella cholangitidis]QMV42476.1 response regulator transcription factor [Cohnella cholangitidis]